MLDVWHAALDSRQDFERDNFLRLPVEPCHLAGKQGEVIVALDGKLGAPDRRPGLPFVLARTVRPAEAEVRLLDGVLAGLAARFSLRKRAADELAVLVDGRAVSFQS